jgi:PAS domain S-box-containing protein
MSSPLPVPFFARNLVSIGQAAFSTDRAGCVRSWNGAAERLYGYSAGQAVGCKISALIILDDREFIDAAPKLYSGVPYHGDWRVRDREGRLLTVAVTSSPVSGPDGEIIGALVLSVDVSARRASTVRKDGSLIDVALRLSPVYDPDGTIVGISGIARDVSAEVRARAELAASERRFRARFEQACTPQALIGPSGEILAANGALCELLGRVRAEVERMPWKALVHPDDSGAGDEAFAALIAGSVEARSWERMLQTRDGTPVRCWSRQPCCVTATASRTASRRSCTTSPAYVRPNRR